MKTKSKLVILILSILLLVSILVSVVSVINRNSIAAQLEAIRENDARANDPVIKASTEQRDFVGYMYYHEAYAQLRERFLTLESAYELKTGLDCDVLVPFNPEDNPYYEQFMSYSSDKGYGGLGEPADE